MGLDTVEFILWAEKEFHIEIPDTDAENILTVGQFTDYVHGRQHTLSKQIIFDRIRDHLANEFRISRDKINYDSRFVKDLGLD